MPRKFKEARQINKLKVIEAAKKLGISQPTLSAWGGERKSPSIDNLENMAELYGVTTDYLLGRQEMQSESATVPIPAKSLPIFHGKPVWSAKYGWLLVNAIHINFFYCFRAIFSSNYRIILQCKILIQHLYQISIIVNY